MDCKVLIAPVGLGMEVQNIPREKQLENAVKKLKTVAPMLEDAEVTMVIEPVNLIEHKGCFLKMRRRLSIDQRCRKPKCQTSVRLLPPADHGR